MGVDSSAEGDPRTPAAGPTSRTINTNVLRSVAPLLHGGSGSLSSAVYGTVSTLAVIVAASHDVHAVGRILLVTAVSALVVWGIHVYAAVLDAVCRHRTPWGEATSRAFREEVGVLHGAVAPLLVLSLGALGWLDPARAVWWSVLVGIGLLAVMPVVWLRRNGETWRHCFAASGVAGSLGLMLLVLKVLAH